MTAILTDRKEYLGELQGQIEQLERTGIEAARSVWRKLVAKVADDGGELNAKEIKAVDEAADRLGIEDPAEAFIEAVELWRSMRSNVAWIHEEVPRMPAKQKRRAEAGLRIRYLTMTEIPALKAEIHQLAAECMNVIRLKEELRLTRAKNPNLFDPEIPDIGSEFA